MAARARWSPADLARAYLDGGAQLLQIRAKNMASGPLLTLCEDVVHAAISYHASVIVNDRADIAVIAKAAGVHLGQDDLAPVDARRLVGPDAIVGFSTHTVEQIKAALREPVSYIAVGPVFGTKTKETGYLAVGLELVAEAARLAAPTPIVAIGGITLNNARSVLDAGAAAVAVIGDLLAPTTTPQGQVEAYLQRLEQHRL